MKGRLITKGFLLSFLLLLIWFKQSTPLGLSNARSLGLGGAYTAVARNNEAPLWNPANLSFKDNKGFTLNLISLGVFVGNNALSFKDYDRHKDGFKDEEGNDEDKEKILSLIPSSGLNFYTEIEASALGISFGPFSLVSWATADLDLNASKSPFEALLLEHDIKESDTISLNGTSGEAYAYATVSLSYGKSISEKEEREIGIGVNLKYLQGIYYEKVMKASGEVILDTTAGVGGGAADVTLRSATGGKGFGLDLGISVRLNQKWTLGFFLSNPICSINWNKETEELSYVFEFDTSDLQPGDSAEVDFKKTEEKGIKSFTTHLPVIAKAGVAYQVKKMLVAFDWEQGFKDAPGSSKKPKLSLGTELKLLSFLPLRAGLSLGGKEGFCLSSGFGLDFGFAFLDLGMINKEALLPLGSKGLGVALDCGLRF